MPLPAVRGRSTKAGKEKDSQKFERPVILKGFSRSAEPRNFTKNLNTPLNSTANQPIGEGDGE